MLADKSLASKVLPAIDARGRVAFMRFVLEVAATAQVFSAYATAATFVTLIMVADGTWRVWGLGAGMPAATDVLGDPEFVPGGGTALVFEWLTRIAEPNPPVELIWGSLDAPLRLANAQSWLLATGEVTADDPHRDTIAEQLSAPASTHPRFGEFSARSSRTTERCTARWTASRAWSARRRPSATTPNPSCSPPKEHVGTYEAGEPLSAHSFLTRHVGNGEWVIAANARRMPVPGWPPTDHVLPDLLIDGN